MNPCHYPQVTRPRSRSPSPHLRPELHVNNENISENASSEGSGSHHHLSEDGSGRKSRSTSRNQRGNDADNFHRHPHSGSRLSPQVDTGCVGRQCRSMSSPSDKTSRTHHEGPRDWRKKYWTCPTCAAGDERELLLRNSASPAVGTTREMDSAAANGVSRTYGSLNDEDRPLIRENDNDNVAESGSRDPVNLPEDFRRADSADFRKCLYTPSMVDELRKRNQLYFMDPITKLLHFHGFPWKLTFQILKVILITIQVLVFGGQRENIVEYFERIDVTYSHLLLQNWDAGYETMPYPPATGLYALYSIDALTSHINFAVEQYYQLPKNSLAAVYFNRDSATDEIAPVVLCYKTNSYIDFPNGTYIITGDMIDNCITLEPYGSRGNYTFDILKFLDDKNVSLVFNRTVDIVLKMQFHTFHLNLVETHYGPTCYNMSLKITYTNTDRSGQLVVTLKTLPSEINCNGYLADQVTDEMNDRKTKVIVLDSVIISVCVISTILCSRSLSRSNKLRRLTAAYFRNCVGKPLNFSSQMEYINLWYVAIICNDVLTIIGSAFKIQLESRIFSISSENYATCSIFLGLGIFLSYVSLLRYLSFFKSYNVLILTLKTSFPHIVRFLICAICLYTGFLFCGWVVFSPYHIKFRRLSTASECLYSLVNGDDMFVTFSALTVDSNEIWYFHRVYLYVFISIFIYVVLSVFIAVIMDNYENLKFYYEKGFPDTDIQRFINEDGQLQNSELFSHVKQGTRCQRWFFCLFPCLACLRSDRKRAQTARDYRQFMATM